MTERRERESDDVRLDRLLLAVQEGDERAWDPLLEGLERRVGPYVLRLTGDLHRAADVTQATLERVFTSLASLSSNELLVPWALAIARRLAWSSAEREARRAEEPIPAGADDALGADEPTPLDRALSREEAERVRAALARVPAADREVLHLFYLEGLRVAWIARVLARPEGTVKWLLHRARASLNRELERASGAGRARASDTG